tara:strand:+ start:95 stop:298 length:204 start_codon:yes stop_codon:yes gene_type:complete
MGGMPGQNVNGKTKRTQLLHKSCEPDAAVRMSEKRFVLSHPTAVATAEHTDRKLTTTHNISAPGSNY